MREKVVLALITILEFECHYAEIPNSNLERTHRLAPVSHVHSREGSRLDSGWRFELREIKK
jgi:hypothetical protein